MESQRPRAAVLTADDSTTNRKPTGWSFDCYLWDAVASRDYSVRQADSVDGAYREASSKMRFENGAGTWEAPIEPNSTGSFYIVIEQ